MPVPRWFLKLSVALLLIIACGSFGAAQSQLDTVSTYDELRFYQGSSDTIFVTHPRYFGLFRRSVCLYEDHGTTIMGIDDCWRRITDNFAPRFWALPGPSPDNQIGRVEREVDALNCAAFSAYLAGGDTIEVDQMYAIDRPVWLFPNNTYLGLGDSCGFVRDDPPQTILTDTAMFGDNLIRVLDNTGFRSRQLINMVNGQAFDSIAGHVSYLASVSSTVGGDTIIWLSGRRVQRQMLPGDLVSLFFPMMENRFSGPPDHVRIENLIFDGNHAAYNLNYDWRVSPTIKLPTAEGVIIDNCRFLNSSNENMILCGATIQNCQGLQLNGSFAHISCNSIGPVTQILYNQAEEVNRIGNDIMRHSEAAITFSAKVQNLRVAYNDFRQVDEHGVGIFKNDDSFNEITDNILEVTKDSIRFQYPYLYPETNLIYNNKYLDTIATAGKCWLAAPKIVGVLPCQDRSNIDSPFELGDTLTLYLDSLYLSNTNENFAKWFVPIYDTTFFQLIDMQLQTLTLSEHHQWRFDRASLGMPALVFDNGHRSGSLGAGNWGYELCGAIGGCTNLALTFTVTRLPADTAQSVPCPLQGLRVGYDGDVNTWHYPPTCTNRTFHFESDAILGRPFLAGEPNLVAVPVVATAPLAIQVYPNPATDYISINGAEAVSGKYKILDMAGKVVVEEITATQSINVSELHPGVYFLQQEGRKREIVGRFVKL